MTARPLAMIAAFCACTVALALGAPSAMAVPPGPSDTAASSQAVAPDAYTPIPSSEYAPASSALAVLNRYIQYSSKGYRLNAPVSVVKKVPGESLASLKKYWSQINVAIAAGDLAVDSQGRGHPLEIAVSSTRVTAGTTGISPAATYRGPHGYVTTHWYGLEIGMDAYLVSKVSNGFGAIGGVAAFIAAVGGNRVAAIISAAAGTMWAMIPFCAHRNGWAYIYITTLISPPQWVCNPFG
jgi:hypothetical protein